MQTAVHNRNIGEKVYDAIQDLILQMEIPPGAAVTETAPSRWRGISRPPIREAPKRWEQAWLDEWLARDPQFHALVFDGAGNERARQIIRTCNLQWHRLKLGMLTLEGRVERSVGEHEAVADAILSGKPARARRALESYLRNLRRELVKVMRLRHYPTL